MKIGETFAALDRLQRSRRYKIAATAAVALLAIGAFIALVVHAAEPGAPERVLQRTSERARATAEGIAPRATPFEIVRRAVDALILTVRPISEIREGTSPPSASGGPTPDVKLPDSEAAGADPNSASQIIARRIPISGAWLVAGLFAAAVAAVAAIIWLGLSLTYLGLLVLGWGLAWPLTLVPAIAGLGQLLVAITPLVLAFLTGMELLKLGLSGPWPVLAVARNVLSEAVRMKVSLVFIVFLLLLLAYVPGSLNAEQPLRYRVQQWLQYGTGLSYVVLALLTLFLAAGTVAFEQRDRIIWQTMTKPVAPWQYLLGKWLGVMGLNAVLLTVTAGGVYLFTEYLRHQPAQGEVAYQVRDDGVPTHDRPDLMTEDRRLLETQVLVARRGARPGMFLGELRLSRYVDARIAEMKQQDSSVQETPALREKIADEFRAQRDESIDREVEERVREAIGRDPTLADTYELREQYRSEIVEQEEIRYRTIAVNTSQTFFFTGLDEAKTSAIGGTMSLRFKVTSGSNDPSQILRMLFVINGVPIERQAALKAAQILTFDSRLVDETGGVRLDIYSYPENVREIYFPDDGLEVLYVAGGYDANFLRIMLVMWVKLGFVAAVAVAAATFASFPVACLVAMTVLFAAESASFLSGALEYYSAQTSDGGTDYLALLVRAVAVPIAALFRSFSELKPTANLVDGRLISWSSMLGTLILLGTWTVAVLAAGWAVFRQRELAIYSGK